MNRNDLPAALAVMQQITSAEQPYEDYMTGDPFFARILSASTELMLGAFPDAKHITKAEYIKQLLALQQKEKRLKGNERARVCIQIASAYYQMSYYGEYWVMNRIYWSANDAPDEISAFNDNYFGCSLAKQWFEKAVMYAANEQTASLSAFMARYCGKLHQRYLETVKKKGYW